MPHREWKDGTDERSFIISAQFGEYGLENTDKLPDHALSHSGAGALDEVIYLGMVLVLWYVMNVRCSYLKSKVIVALWYVARA